MLQKINIKNKEVFVIGGIALILLIDIFLVLSWQMRSVVGLYGAANEKKQALEQFEFDINKLSPYKERVAQLENTERAISDSMRNVDETLFLIENISSMAKANGVKILQINPRRDIVEDVAGLGGIQYSQVEIDISAEADFHSLGNFISKVESTGIFYRTSSLEVQSDDKNIYLQRVRIAFRCPVKRR